MLDILPTELLITIFGLVSHSDIKALRQTCSRLYNVCLADPLIRNERLHIDNRMLKPGGNTVTEILLASERNFYHVSVTNIHYSDFFWVFHKFGRTIETIILITCTFDYVQFSRGLSDLRALKMLQLENCDNFLIEGVIFEHKFLEHNMNHLNNLYGLEITNTKYLTDGTLSRMIMLFPYIEHLSLEKTTLNVHEGVFQFNYRNREEIFFNPSKNVLTINYICVLIQYICNSLRSLNFANTLINNYSLSKVLNIAGLNLNKLNLNFCRELRFNSNTLVGHWQPDLTELQLANCDLVNDMFLFHLSKSLPNITILNISFNNNFTDIGFRHLQCFVKLRELDITFCVLLTSKAMQAVLCSRNLSKGIKVLKINRTSILNEDLIQIMNLLQLSELEINHCSLLTNDCLSSIFRTQKFSLSKLEMAGLNISDVAITGIEETNQTLPSINVKKFKSMPISDDTIQDIMRESEIYYNSFFQSTRKYSLQDLRKLEALNLNQCLSLTDCIFATYMRFVNLRELYMAGLLGLTTRTLFCIAYNCPALEVLNLSGTDIDDTGICVISRKLHRLKNLCLKDCTSITNKTLRYIILHCKVLQKLNVQGCSYISEHLLKDVQDLPSMVVVTGTPNAEYDMDGRIPIPPPPPMDL